MNAINWKKLLLPNIPYLLFVYLFDKVGQAVRLAPGADLSGNTKGDGEEAGEDFWVKSERLFYCALIGYIWYEAPEEEKELHDAA